MPSYLRSHNVTFEPIEHWPGEESRARPRSPYCAPWSATLGLLDRELFKLKAKKVVMQVDLDRTRIRQDGAPYSGAKMKGPRVILSFQSKHGPLMYPVDTFDRWQDNVRAIALALEALRKVDRYGVSSRGEQYRGYQTLPAPASDGFSSRHAAWAFLVSLLKIDNPSGSIATRGQLEGFLRDADRKTHPDIGGDANLFNQVQRAREKLLG